MRSTLIILLATVAGIGLAWLLFAPAPAPIAAAPRAPVTAPAEAPPPPPSEAPAPPDPGEAHAAFQARINQPDAALAGMQSSSWTVIRRELSATDSDAARALVTDTSNLVRDLREARLRPDNADIPALAARQAELRERIKASGITTPLLEEQFKRLDELNASRAHEAAAPPGAPATPSSQAATPAME